jgi:hypothetical protein
MTTAECARRLEAGAGRLWRYAPLLSLLQRQAMFMARGSGAAVIASRRALREGRLIVSVTISPRSQGGSILALTSTFDPMIPIFSLVPLTALVGFVVARAVYAFLGKVAFLHLGFGHVLVLLAVILVVQILIMRQAPRGAESAPPDEEVVDFLRRHLEAQECELGA